MRTVLFYRFTYLIDIYFFLISFYEYCGLLYWLTCLMSSDWTYDSDPCVSQPHKGHLISKLNFKTVPVLSSLDPSLIFLFHQIPSPVYPPGFSFCFFHSLLAIFILSSNNNNTTLQLSIFGNICHGLVFFFSNSLFCWTQAPINDRTVVPDCFGECYFIYLPHIACVYKSCGYKRYFILCDNDQGYS